MGMMNVIRVGKGQRLKTLVTITELERWVDRQSSLGG